MGYEAMVLDVMLAAADAFSVREKLRAVGQRARVLRAGSLRLDPAIRSMRRRLTVG